MRYKRLIAAAIAAGLTTAGTAMPAAALDVYAFKGTVTDALGRFLSAATVKDGAGKETATAADGTYRIGESNTGRYTLTANRSDTNTASQTVTVQLPLDHTVDFTLLYKISGVVSPSSVSTATGPASPVLTVTSHAPQPGAEGEAGGKSCVRVIDGRTGTKSPAALISTSGTTSTWRYTASVPQGTAQGSYSLVFAAEDCAGTTVLSQTGTTSYVVDNTAPTIRRLTPSDNGNTIFTTQRLLASIRDTGGSGLNPSSVTFTLTADDGTTVTLPGSYASATGWAKTAAQTLARGRAYRVSVTARDFAGNVVTATQRPLAEGGGFLVTSVLAQVTLADIPRTPCRIEERGLTERVAICDNVPLRYAASTATVDGTRHGPDGGFVDHTASLETAVLKTTIAGQDLSMGAYQATDARWAPKTGALRFDGPPAGLGPQSVPVAERQLNIGTLEVPIPAAWTGDVSLEMAATATTAALAACADPSSSGAAITCTPDPMANRVLVSLNVPADQVAAVATSHAAAAGGQVLHIYSGGYQAVMPAAAAAALTSDPRVRGVARMLLRTGAVPAALAESVVDRMLQGTLPDGFEDLQQAASSAPRPAAALPGGDGAYQVDLVAGGDTIGYGVTSNVFEGTPVLRLTHGDLNELAEARRAAVEAASGKTVASYSFVHLDAFTEAARYALTDGSLVDVSLNTGDPVDDGRLGVFTSSSDRPARPADAALVNQLEWNNAGGDISLTPETWPSTTQAGPTNSLPVRVIQLVDGAGPAFPNYTWYRGCTPTAAGMIEAYWSQRGYPSIMSTDAYNKATLDAEDGFPDGDSPQSRLLIDAIGDKMGTATDGSGGTYLHNIGPGIRNFELSKGINRNVVTVGNPTKSRFLAQFDNEQVPTTASFISWLMLPVTPAPGYGTHFPDRIHHSVALEGYVLVNSAAYMVMHDDFRYDGETIVAWDGDWAISQFDYPK